MMLVKYLQHQIFDIIMDKSDFTSPNGMFCVDAAFDADANEQLNNSSLNESVWDSSVYYPPIETSSGAYYYNYLEGYCYGPVYYEYQYYPEQCQPFVANTYGEFPNDYQTVHYYSQVFYDIHYYPVDVYFVPVMYYPVSFVPVTYSAIEVPYEYNDLSGLNDVQYATSQNSVEMLTHFSAHEAVSAEMTTFEVYYEEDGERLNDAPFNNDDKKENNDNKSSSCNSEAMCKEESRLEVLDLDYEDGMLELCSRFEKLSLYDNEEKSATSKPNDNSGKNSSNKSEDSSVEVSSSKSDNNSSEDSSSCDSDEDNETCIKRQGNIIDLHHVDDYTHSDFATSSSSGDNKFITKENSEVISEVDEESDPISIGMIVSSEEYLFIQDNLENPKIYKDYLYRRSLKNNPRSEKSSLFDVLPTIEEESYPLMDDTPTVSEDEISMQDPMIVSPEMISSVEDEPVTRKMKQPKQRFKAFKKWLCRTFCCCCSTKDPP